MDIVMNIHSLALSFDMYKNYIMTTPLQDKSKSKARERAQEEKEEHNKVVLYFDQLTKWKTCREGVHQHQEQSKDVIRLHMLPLLILVLDFVVRNQCPLLTSVLVLDI